MKWIEIKLSVDGEAAEAVAELLQRYGHQGISIEQEGIMPEAYNEDEVPVPDKLTVRAYLPESDSTEHAKQQLEEALRYMNMMYPMPTPEYTIVDEQDWANAWKDHYHPIRLGKRILIRPVWHDIDIQPDDIELALDPGMAFGTGTHPTTQLCLIALEDIVPAGARVLDLGTGSGILAIAAAKLGASYVLGLDIDELSVTSSKENIERNNVADKVFVEQGSLENVITSARRFDLIVVNIISKVIIEMCHNGLGQTVRPGGLAVFSGIVDYQVPEVEEALRATGLIPHNLRQQGDWVVIEARRPE
jgi:ribosomal protein L11 methyltransferase